MVRAGINAPVMSYACSLYQMRASFTKSETCTNNVQLGCTQYESTNSSVGMYNAKPSHTKNVQQQNCCTFKYQSPRQEKEKKIHRRHSAV